MKRRTARIAGLLYLLLSLASLGGFLGLPLVQGNADVLANIIISDPLRFRIGIVCDVLTGVLALLLVLTLYKLLEEFNRSWAVLMVAFLATATPIGFAITFNDFAAEAVLTGRGALHALSDPERAALTDLFLAVHRDAIFALEIFWGLWLLPFGLLVLRSGYFPRVLGFLLLLAGAAYVAHSLISLLLPGLHVSWYEYATMVARAAGEFPILLYLLFRGVRPPAQALPLQKSGPGTPRAANGLL